MLVLSAIKKQCPGQGKRLEYDRKVASNSNSTEYLVSNGSQTESMKIIATHP